MSTFTDEDLKRLKERFPEPKGNNHILSEYLAANKIRDLIARLEAAELVVRYFYSHMDCSAPIEKEALDAWKRAAGKDGEGK